MPISREVAQSLRALFHAYRREEVPVSAVAKAFRDALGERFTEVHERLFLFRVLSRDAKKLNHVELAQLYDNYVSGKKSAELTPANVVLWCLRQSKGRARDLLHELLGPGYHEVMRRAWAHKVIPVMEEKDALKFMGLVGKPDFYRDLRRELEGYGHFFEADHLVEKRFLLNSPRWTTSLDPDDLEAYVVPKNQAVADQLIAFQPDVFIPYVHLPKTLMMNRFIPHGAENLFEPQHWWDAHIHVFESLDMAPENYLPRIKQIFHDYLPGKGRGFKYRTGIPDEVFFPGRWPDPLSGP